MKYSRDTLEANISFISLSWIAKGRFISLMYLGSVPSLVWINQMTVTEVRVWEGGIDGAEIPIQRKSWTDWIWTISALEIHQTQGAQCKEGTPRGSFWAKGKDKGQMKRGKYSLATSIENMCR